MEAKASDSAVAVETNPRHGLTRFEAQQDIDYGAVANGNRGHVAHPLVPAVQTDHVSPPAGKTVRIVAAAHSAVEVLEDILHPSRREAGQELACRRTVPDEAMRATDWPVRGSTG